MTISINYFTIIQRVIMYKIRSYDEKKNIIICTILIIITILLILCKIFVINNQNITNIKSYIRIKKSQKILNKYKFYPQKDAINIVNITDANYIIPLNVAIYSAIKNKNKNSKYNFFVIGIDLKKDDIKELTKQSTAETPIIVINNHNIYDFYPFKHNTHVPIGDCLKFNIPDIFPNFDKMLYLDGDVIVQKDLNDLYNMNIDGYYAAGHLNDYDKDDKNQRMDLKLKKYFNNGVILLNLKKMREDDIPDKMLRYKIFKAPRFLITQDTFNVVLDNKVKNFDFTYNITTNLMENEKISDTDQYLKTGVIIHYAGSSKPWKKPDILYGATWNKYYQEFLNEYK